MSLRVIIGVACPIHCGVGIVALYRDCHSTHEKKALYPLPWPRGESVDLKRLLG